MLLYFQPALYEAARLTGYVGCEPPTFWDAAKKIEYQ
jgi:hypothetical protein